MSHGTREKVQLEAKKKMFFIYPDWEVWKRQILLRGPGLWQCLCIAWGLGAAGAPRGETHCCPWNVSDPGAGQGPATITDVSRVYSSCAVAQTV